jgi:hypothetical protein
MSGCIEGYMALALVKSCDIGRSQTVSERSPIERDAEPLSIISSTLSAFASLGSFFVNLFCQKTASNSEITQVVPEKKLELSAEHRALLTNFRSTGEGVSNPHSGNPDLGVTDQTDPLELKEGKRLYTANQKYLALKHQTVFLRTPDSASIDQRGPVIKVVGNIRSLVMPGVVPATFSVEYKEEDGE